jgi:hypothetical protein
MNISSVLEIVFFIAMIVSLIVDTILSAKWNRMYFTAGLPLLSIRIPVWPRKNDLPSCPDLEKQFHSGWGPSLVFRELDTNVYAFREKMLEFRLFDSSPVMHGMLYFDSDTGQVFVKGHANWFILCFVLMASMVASKMQEPVIALGVLVLVLGVCYWIQYRRYSKVAAYAAQAWSSETLSPGK